MSREVAWQCAQYETTPFGNTVFEWVQGFVSWFVCLFIMIPTQPALQRSQGWDGSCLDSGSETQVCH